MSSKYTIRQLTPWSIGATVELAQRFHSEAGIKSEFSQSAFIVSMTPSNVFKVGLYHGVTVVGILAGVITGQFMTNSLIAQELMWYVLPEHRGSREALEMFKAFEAWASEKGASDIIMASLGGPEEKAACIYRKFGYRLIESHFIKHLKD